MEPFKEKINPPSFACEASAPRWGAVLQPEEFLCPEKSPNEREGSSQELRRNHFKGDLRHGKENKTLRLLFFLLQVHKWLHAPLKGLADNLSWPLGTWLSTLKCFLTCYGTELGHGNSKGAQLKLLISVSHSKNSGVNSYLDIQSNYPARSLLSAIQHSCLYSGMILSDPEA